MAGGDLLGRRQPTGAKRLAVEHTGGWQSRVGAPHLDLRAVHTAGRVLEAAAGRQWLRTAADLNPLIRHPIDHRLQFQLEVAEFASRAEERVHAGAGGDGAADDGAVLDGESVATVQVSPAVERRAVEEIDPAGLGDRRGRA